MALPLHTDLDGVVHKLGNIPQALTGNWPVFGKLTSQTPPLVPRSEWVDRIKELQAGRTQLEFLDSAISGPVQNQGSVGQCNAEAAVGCLHTQRRIQGLKAVELSAGDLYHRINGGVDGGSLLEHGMRELQSRGVGTAATCGGTIWYRGWKGAPDSERAKYKALEVWIAPSFAHMMSGALLGFTGVSGIMWYSNYSALDADGWLPRPAGGAGGHAIEMLICPTYRERGGSVEFALGHQNSWGSRWGRKGRMYLPEWTYTGNVGGWWILRTVTTEPGDIPQPKFK